MSTTFDDIFDVRLVRKDLKDVFAVSVIHVELSVRERFALAVGSPWSRVVNKSSGHQYGGTTRVSFAQDIFLPSERHALAV